VERFSISWEQQVIEFTFSLAVWGTNIGVTYVQLHKISQFGQGISKNLWSSQGLTEPLHQFARPILHALCKIGMKTNNWSWK
jgi:hypothetical protein